MDKTKLLEDLFTAYYDARKNKRNTYNALAFERDFESHLFELCDEIMERRYKLLPGICFMVSWPVKREVFAADFRDRVIHHLIYNYIAPIFERDFINDSYSCRKKKGTHYGVNRVDHFIRSCSKNYKEDCYVMKLDIKGYFMSMNRKILFRKIERTLAKGKEKCDFDYSLVMYLIEKVVYNDPTVGCKVKGSRSDWDGLPRSKSLFYAKEYCGLPIGNLTSQLFGNVYMDDFDHFVRDELGIHFYGRYVDDMIFVHKDKKRLLEIVPMIKKRLESVEELELHPNKIYIQHYTKGVGFLGAYIKPGRKYILNRTKGHFYQLIMDFNKLVEGGKVPSKEEIKKFVTSINSYLGLMVHYSTYNIRKKMLLQLVSQEWWKYVYIGGRMQKVIIKKGKTDIV